MSSQFDQTHHFTDCKIDFPSVTYCGKVFNDLFKLGLSVNQFEDKYKRASKSNIILQTPNTSSSIQYNLQTDIWGPKEFVMVNRGNPDYQVGIVYGIREHAEFNTVISYLTKCSNIDLIQNKPSVRIFQVNVPYTTYERTREVLISVQTQTEQATLITLLLNF